MADSLLYVSDREPGITRRRAGRGFTYIGPDGRRLTGEARQRVERLAVPPAYRDVWICPSEHGHIQATGRDARGRKQYCYHPLWQSSRSETKYAQLPAFGRGLPALRRRMDLDLRRPAGDRSFTLAALVLLLDRAWLRIGNSAYLARNGSFGATTLQRRHVRIFADSVRLDYRAKGGRRVRQVLHDRRLQRILNRIGDLPGKNLFTWIDDEGQPCPIGSGDVNGYISAAMGAEVTAKAFRTWGGTLAAFEVAATTCGKTLTVGEMAAAAAERLCNTPAICRSSYIHPAVLDLAGLEEGERLRLFSCLRPARLAGLRPPEARLLGFLRSCAA